MFAVRMKKKAAISAWPIKNKWSKCAIINNLIKNIQALMSREWWGSGLCSLCSIISISRHKKGTKSENKTYMALKMIC